MLKPHHLGTGAWLTQQKLPHVLTRSLKAFELRWIDQLPMTSYLSAIVITGLSHTIS